MISMHPGEYISEVYLEPEEISLTELAERMDVSTSTISRIINGKSDITPQMALKLSYVVGRSPESWMAMQSTYSLHVEGSRLEKDRLKPFPWKPSNS